MPAKLIMIQGTSSHAGKSLVVTALCRVLKDMGFKVAPFKAQNMALNSGVTPDGLEMGRAQILQAEAAGIEPRVEMNPILLKPSSDVGAQVVVMGRPVGNMTALSYYARKKELIKLVVDCFNRLRSEFDIVVIEGAGSPAEINLKDKDIVNMGLAKRVKSPVLIVGDIDRGGVFASFYGTYHLLDDEERSLVKGFIINKFRGDRSLLEDGLKALEDMTGIPTVGVIPFMRDLILDDEDGVSLEGVRRPRQGEIKIKVVKLPRISNFTDFHPLELTDGVSLEYVEDPMDLMDADVAIVPGSKNTIQDLRFMKKLGFDLAIRLLSMQGRVVMGICGGYQMLGECILDPYGVEGGGEEEGLSLIPSRTVMSKDKTLSRVSGEGVLPGHPRVHGYEIHMGVTFISEAKPMVRVTWKNGASVQQLDGFADTEKRVFGTYIHGIFDSADFRRSFLRWVSGEVVEGIEDYSSIRERMIRLLADTFRESVDMDAIMRIIEGG